MTIKHPWHYLVFILFLFSSTLCAQGLTQEEAALSSTTQAFEYALDNQSLNYAQLSTAEANMLEALQRRNQALNEPSSNPKVFGFGPAGVRSLRLELKVLWLRIQAQPRHIDYGWQQLKTGLKLSPMPLLAAVIQLMISVAVFVYWLNHAVPIIRDWSKAKGLDPSKHLSRLWQSTSWWYMRLRRPLEAWLLLSFILSVIAQLLSFINFEPLQVVVNWLLWGTLAILLVDGLGAARHRRWQRKDAQAKLRLRSVKWLGRIFIVTGLLLSLMKSLGCSEGTLSAWVSTLFIWAILPVLIVIIRWWRSPVMDKLNTTEHKDKPLPLWVLKRQKGLISLVAVLLGGAYLIFMGCLRWLISLASEREVVRSAMAYLFRIEVARQSALEQQRNQLKPLEVDNIEAFKGSYIGQWLEGIADEEIQLFQESCLQQRSTINVVYAGRGRGKSAFISRLQADLETQGCTCVQVKCPPEGGFAALLDELGKALSALPQMGEISGARDVASALKETDTMVITLDDIQRLIQPTIGGLKEFERLVRFIRRTSAHLSWVFSIEAASWRFVERARGERFLFDVELELPRWKEESIAALIEQRCADANLDVSYDGMVLPRQMDMQDETQEESASRGYARILWEYAKGNPGVALYLWSQSLFKDEQGKTVVRLFDVPSLAGLESLSVTLLLVLRAILQLELAHKDEVAQATNLSSDEVVDALRLLMSKRYVERAESNLYTISWPWYRAITTVLNRQHLLIL